MNPTEMEWHVIYDLYADDISRFLHCLLRNQSDVDDLRQETFVKALHHWNAHTERTNTKTWLLSIARNLAVDKIRREKRLQTLLRFLPLDSSSETLEETLWQDEKSHLIQSAVRSLPMFYRLVVTLRGIQELTPAETAQVLGCSINKVNVNYHRALKKLRNLLEEEELYHVLIPNR